MSKKIWTWEVRSDLYSTLVERFGPYETWTDLEKRSRMSENGDKAFDEVLSAFVQHCYNRFGCRIGSDKNPNGLKATKLQIKCATGIQKMTRKQAHLFILNRAAAFESGFIGCDLLISVIGLEMK